MRRSLERLGRLNELIVAEEARLRRDWAPADASFDAFAVLGGAPTTSTISAAPGDGPG